MRKKSIIYCTALFVISISAVLLHKTATCGSFIEENAEALARDESGIVKGRWKTVGCNSDNFSEWSTYCCPNDAYDNCDGRTGSCPHYPYNGCQDTFWSR